MLCRGYVRHPPSQQVDRSRPGISVVDPWGGAGHIIDSLVVTRGKPFSTEAHGPDVRYAEESISMEIYKKDISFYPSNLRSNL